MRYVRRFFSLFLALILLGSLALPAAGADEDKITIATVQDFLQFVKDCTRDTWSLDRTVELTADLDLSSTDVSPVPIFQGTFHGNGHTISGLSLDQEGSKSGLFRTLTQSALVEDLTVEGTLAPQGSASQAGLLTGENYGTIRRCSARGQVTGQEDVGGLVGLNGEGGCITSCSNTAAVTGVTNVGGIAGRNLGTLEQCSNAGEINTQADQETPTSVGGIAGLSRGTIRSCTNTGAVGYQHVGYNKGGIAGLQSGEISGCSNTGAIKGRKDVGGIVGQFEPSTSLTYGPSPSQQLSDSLSDLFGQMGTFTDQLNDMISQGVEDAQAIHDSISAIQDRTHSAETEGHEDFQAMSDSLYEYTTAISADLDALREALSLFSDQAGDQIQQALDQSDALLGALKELAQQADTGLGQSIQALEDTVSAIRTRVQTIQAYRQAMARELEALKEYIADVVRLCLAGQFEQALQLPFPSVDPASHFSAIIKALGEIPGLAAKLPDQWSTIYDRTSQKLDQAGREADQALDRLYDALTSLNQAGDTFSHAAEKSLDAVSKHADQIQDLLKKYTDTLGDKIQSAVDDVDQELTAIQDRVEQMTQAAGEDNDTLYASSQAILDQMEQVRRALSDLNREPEVTVTDLTDEIDQGPGLVMGCSASGTVEGDSNVGGIAGTVSAELGDDPEATLDLGDLSLMSDVYATLRAVVRDCRFDGHVTVKNDCGGGVAGRCEAGAIVDCAARGGVETGGDYCGGITGRTRGKVIRCAALTSLTGQSWLGGVAGLGQDITDCRTMVEAEGDGEYRGAVAGQSEGTLAGNCYLLEDLAGLDGVDYEGKAQGLDFSSFSQLDYIPSDFLSFSYRFVADGRTVAEISFSYGDDLDLSQVPQAPLKDGQYGQWPQFPTRDLRRSLVIQAQFTSPTSTLADQEGVAQLLAEGTFSPDAAFSVVREELPSQSVEGCTALSAWNYKVTGSQQESITLCLRADGAKRPAVAVYQDGAWKRVDSTLEGSYLVFTGPVGGKVLLLEQDLPVVLILLVSAAGAGLLAGAFLLLHRRRTHAKPPREEEPV